MAAGRKLPHGSAEWFAMIGELMVEAARSARLPASAKISLVERYTDGVELGPGVVEGLRFDIVAGVPSFSIGAGREERGDITVEVTRLASRLLNTRYGADPEFAALAASLQRSGDFVVEGDFTLLGDWFHSVHDRIVDRTAGDGA